MYKTLWTFLAVLSLQTPLALAQLPPQNETPEAVLDRISATIPDPKDQVRFRELMSIVGDVRGHKCSPEFAKIFEVTDLDNCLDGRQLIQWFGKRVSAIEIKGPTVNQAHVAIRTIELDRDHYYFDPVWPHWTNLMEISSIYHEARHMDGFVHLGGNQCPPRDIQFDDGFSVAKYCESMDNTPDGTRGMQVELMMNIAVYCENCSDDFRAKAKEEAIAQIANVVTKSARETLIVDIFLK